jgi:hypothetical protein
MSLLQLGSSQIGVCIGDEAGLNLRGCVLRDNLMCNFITPEGGGGPGSCLTLRGNLLTPPKGSFGGGCGLQHGHWADEVRLGFRV